MLKSNNSLAALASPAAEQQKQSLPGTSASHVLGPSQSSQNAAKPTAPLGASAEADAAAFPTSVAQPSSAAPSVVDQLNQASHLSSLQTASESEQPFTEHSIQAAAEASKAAAEATAPNATGDAGISSAAFALVPCCNSQRNLRYSYSYSLRGHVGHDLTYAVSLSNTQPS